MRMNIHTKWVTSGIQTDGMRMKTGKLTYYQQQSLNCNRDKCDHLCRLYQRVINPINTELGLIFKVLMQELRQGY